MQQTNKYGLNLIETSDAFSPAPLNENARKLEAAITEARAEATAAAQAETAARTAADTALSARVTTLEGHRIATGTSAAGTINLGFTPIFVLVGSNGGLGFCIRNSSTGPVRIIDGGFTFGAEGLRSGLYIAIK